MSVCGCVVCVFVLCVVWCGVCVVWMFVSFVVGRSWCLCGTICEAMFKGTQRRSFVDYMR